MIRAVLFDFDGVLTTERTGSQSTLRSLAHHTGIPEARLRRAYARHNPAMLAGYITHADMWEEFCAEVGRRIDYRLLEVAFVETPLDCEMLELVERLHGRCKTALVTDNKADRIRAIFDHHGLDELFDAVSISAELGCGKDTPLPFRRVLEALDVQAQDCVFIDNSMKNLVVPQQMGMATVLYDDVKRDTEGLWRLLQGR